MTSLWTRHLEDVEAYVQNDTAVWGGNRLNWQRELAMTDSLSKAARRPFVSELKIRKAADESAATISSSDNMLPTLA